MIFGYKGQYFSSVHIPSEVSSIKTDIAIKTTEIFFEKHVNFPDSNQDYHP